MIRIGVIGAGHWGPNLIRNFHDGPRSEVAWVVDRDPARLAQVEARMPDVHCATDPAAALRDAAVDAVVIATPTSTHYPLVREALERGKHVLVEKPITARAAEADDLCRLADQAGKVLMVGHVFLYNPAVRFVKDVLDRGDLGRLFYISMVRTNLGPIRMDVNAAWDLAAHDLSIANHWLGGQPLTVSAAGGAWINGGIEDAIFATLRYPGEVLVNLHVSWLNPRKAREITVVGDAQMLTLDDMELTEPIRVYDKGVTQERTSPSYVDSFASFRASVREGAVTIPRVPGGEPLRTECEHFLDCVALGKEPLTSGHEAAAVVRALEAIDRSMRGRGREEQVPG